MDPMQSWAPGRISLFTVCGHPKPAFWDMQGPDIVTDEGLTHSFTCLQCPPLPVNLC